MKNWVLNDKMQCYQLLNVVYCAQPVTPQLQSMNIFIPAAYMNADGSINSNGTCGKYTAETAPIAFQNQVAGYSEAPPALIGSRMSQGEELLKAGIVYVSCGSRGRQTKDNNDMFVGKSPESLVDLKAAVRFLKHNRQMIAGNIDRIVSIGTSAGGAMSSLLGCTGNSVNYAKSLQAIGAVMDETDDIFAAQCYCPIIDLDHADAAYEWMFQGSYTLEERSVRQELSPFQVALSRKLSKQYIKYFNSIGLKNPASGELLCIEEDGRNGSGYDYLMKMIERSANKHLNMIKDKKLSLTCTAKEYISGDYTYLSKRRGPRNPDSNPDESVEFRGIDKSSWLSWDNEKAIVSSLDDMEEDYLVRMKSCTSFDDFDYQQPETQVFGSTTVDRRHFSEDIFPLLEELQELFPMEYERYAKEFQAVIGDKKLEHGKCLYNPYYYIGTKETCDCANHFRIRVGTKDAHTSFTMSMILALKLQAIGVDVDYALVWDEGHGPADYIGELTEWFENIC